MTWHGMSISFVDCYTIAKNGTLLNPVTCSWLAAKLKNPRPLPTSPNNKHPSGLPSPTSLRPLPSVLAFRRASTELSYTTSPPHLTLLTIRNQTYNTLPLQQTRWVNHGSSSSSTPFSLLLFRSLPPPKPPVYRAGPYHHHLRRS